MDGADKKHGHSLSTPIVRVVRKRTTANKKERKRTQSINAAFQDLRDRIPNVPADTKLSKVSTLASIYQIYCNRILLSLVIVCCELICKTSLKYIMFDRMSYHRVLLKTIS